VSATIRDERAGSVLGVEGRFFAVIAWPNGKLANQQFKATRYWQEKGRSYRITAELRFDDDCKNGHETFSITADIREDNREYMGGCCHEEIEKRFPEFAPLIEWHLCSTDGPMHYPANALYHALEHGATHAWVYYTGAIDPLAVAGTKERLVGYVKADKAREAEGQTGYRVQWDEKTVKTAHLEHARSCAVWPDAALEQLRDKAALDARLPALLERFKAAMLACGFVYPA
jgi:hypothetical protein